MTVKNGCMALEVMNTFKEGDRSAVVCKRGEGNYIVGKNYEITDGEITWCWGCYDIKDMRTALNIALAWVYD